VRDQKDPFDLVSFNEGLLNFDSDDLSLEELERRLELAVWVIPMLDAACAQLNCCQVACEDLTCGAFTACCNNEPG